MTQKHQSQRGDTKKKEVVIPILNDEYKVVVCWGDSKEIAKVLRSWHHKKQDMMTALTERRGVCFYGEGCHPIIALPNKPKTPEEIGTLAHEATHAIVDIFLKINEPTTGELFAHSVGAVVRNTLKS